MDTMTMERLEKGFCKVLHDYAEKGFASVSGVEVAKNALSGLVKLKMLESMEQYGESYVSRFMNNANCHCHEPIDESEVRQQLEKMAEGAGTEREKMLIKAALQKL